MKELTIEELKYIALALDQSELEKLIEKGKQYSVVSPIIAVADQIKDDCQGYKLTIVFKNGHFNWSFKKLTVRKKKDQYRYIVDNVTYESPEDIIKALDLEDEWTQYKQAGENLGAGPLNFLKRKMKIKVEKVEKSENDDES